MKSDLPTFVLRSAFGLFCLILLFAIAWNLKSISREMTLANCIRIAEHGLSCSAEAAGRLR